jgi:serine/threonine-protein phosphatase 2A activator
MEETPVEGGKQRFGNKAFKTFHKKVEDISIKEICDILPEEQREASIELNYYFLDSFGSNVRIDYGTGHELAFTIFLYCLYTLGMFNKGDYEEVVHVVFYK